MTASDPTPTTRRTVLRVGAHAAWIVPAVTVVAATPALAASGPAALSVTAMPTPSGLNKLSVGATLTNANSQPSLALEVQVRVTPSAGGDFSTSTASAVTGFTLVKAAGDGTTSSTFMYTATSAGQVPGGGSLAFDPTITLTPGITGTGAAGSGTLIIVASPNGFGTTDGQGIYNNTFA